MDIIFQGNHSSEETLEALTDVLRLFRERYHIHQFREIHLSVTLLDENGDEVELVDNETTEAYRTLEVRRDEQKLSYKPTAQKIHLVIDNTKK